MKQLLPLLLLFSMTINSQSKTEKYFKHLVFRETPYSLTKGRIPISNEESKTANHYKLTYDDQNRLVLIEYRYGNHQISRRRAGILDGFRNIHSKTVITYNKNLEIRTFYKPNGDQRNNGMNVYKEVYEYNEKGERIGAKFYNKEGKLTNNTWNIAEYIWEQAGDFNVVEKRKNKKGDYVTMRPYYHFMTTLYKYTKDGLLISMNHIDENQNLINDFNDKTGIAIDKAEYDRDLNLIGFKFYNANNEPVVGSFLESAGGKIEYDSNGNCIKYATINLNGGLMLSREKAYDVYKFDSFGNYSEIAHYGINNEPLEFRGYSKMKFIYDPMDLSNNGKVKRYHLKQD
jgi:hypothetical protein